MRKRSNIQCEWFENPDRQWLEKAWIELEQDTQASFFLSWLWIGTWLDTFVENFTVIEARRNGKTVGLGILVTQPFLSKMNPFRRKHYLHRTGIGQEDQIWIEYNDFLVASDHAAEIRTAMLSSCAYWMNKSDALIVGACGTKDFSFTKQLGLLDRTTWETTHYFLQLEPLKQSKDALLKSISRSARYQITRSLRKYSEIGDIKIERATTFPEAVNLLSIAEPYHKARWGNGKQGSGFYNSKFMKFHMKLIQNGLSTSAIEINHVRAGDETIGIVYNFRYKNRVYFYLGAMNYKHSEPQYKPGLVAHYLLIEKAIEEGVDIYDFMGGVARYKATFSDVQGNLAVYQFEHPRPLLSCENQIRKVKQKIIEKKQQHYCK
ncbi:GNAT family N-acetyltransferase [Vibrio sp. TH_r3]|uniref:GNAT family N-acetyltransferase n=1 Tax=Vibrio sp. TH_r3 TaxID=3082084 RepID=UPI002953A03F|nr:GNAT family N-acetyltransferase [Vibrio sp. TH_r3]MDV7102912.1 GNAT family N-acetyltransferase [Vibrio sp. TH_r3]